MSDCTDTSGFTNDNNCTSGITFDDTFGASKTLKKFTEKYLHLAQASCPTGKVCGIGQWGQVAPIGKAIREQAIKRDNEIHGLTSPTVPIGGTSLEEQKRASDALEAKNRADQTRVRTKHELEQPDPLGILATAVDGFEVAAGTEAARRTWGAGTQLLKGEGAEAWSRFSGDGYGGALRISRGLGAAVGSYYLDRVSSSFTTPGSLASTFLIPSDAEMAVVAASSTLPVPKFVLGAKGNLLQRLGARALEEGVLWAGTKLGVMLYGETTDPAVERRSLDAAKQAQADDHLKKTTETMMAAIDAWKALGNHDIQIRQQLDDAQTQISTTDPAKLAETRRDLVALYTAFGETRLANGTQIGALGADGKPLNGPDWKPIPNLKVHEVFGGTDYDFGGVALANLNTAKNVLMAELGIASSDPVANRIYSNARSGISRILDPHEDLPAIFDQLKTMVQTDSPDAKWLSVWLATRVGDQKKLLSDEERAFLGAKELGHVFVPTFNNYVLAKVYQDQALLEMAYAAAGQDPRTHLAKAHDLLKLIKGENGVRVPLSWDGRPFTRNGEPLKRGSDLPQIIELYKSLGGSIDWETP